MLSGLGFAKKLANKVAVSVNNFTVGAKHLRISRKKAKLCFKGRM